jgi:hypothetical protein
MFELRTASCTLVDVGCPAQDCGHVPDCCSALLCIALLVLPSCTALLLYRCLVLPPCVTAARAVRRRREAEEEEEAREAAVCGAPDVGPAVR